MIEFAKTTLCPFCFERFPVANARFRCTNPRCSERAEDPIYAEYQGLQKPMVDGLVFEVPQSFAAKLRPPNRAKCPTCNRETFKRVCPRCHFELLTDVGMTEEKIIAIMGGRGTGKSNYIAVLIDRLRNEVGRNFQAAIMCRGDTTHERYETVFHNPIYRDGKVVEATLSASIDSQVKIPLVFRITFSQKRRRAVTLVLFDTAGEDMRSLDSMSTEARYICYSDALIFLLDPLQIDAVRQMLSNESLPQEDPEAAPERIAERLRELHERQLGIKFNQKIDKPIAFTLSKTDMLKPILDPSTALLRDSQQRLGYLDRNDIESVHSEIASYLETWMGSNFGLQLKSHYQDFHFFGVSTFGHAPSPDGRLNGLSPKRVEDPLLWILSRFNLIETR